jgi:Domain of unknown function (DUF1905)
VNARRFSGTILSGHKEDAVEVPFDPQRTWDLSSRPIRPGRRGYPVQGEINGTPFASDVVSRSRRFWLLLPEPLKRRAGVSTGDEVAVSLQPREDSQGPEPDRVPRTASQIEKLSR